MFGPGLPSETVVDQMATLLDIAPTITDLFDIDGDTQWEGESLLPAIRGEDLRDRDPVILGHGDVLVCQTDRWRLVWWRGRPNPHSEGGEWELWDLTDSSRVPLNHHEDVVDQLQQELYIHLERAEESESLSEPAVGEETKGRLEALGYR
jgi:arylsulfatase A-like enzyme